MNAGKRLLFPLFWKVAFFFCAVFLAASLSLLFAARATLAPALERNARARNGAINYNTALMANTALAALKNDTELFVAQLGTRTESAEQNALTYAFYTARPDIAAVVIRYPDEPLSAARKIINVGLPQRLAAYGAVDAFLAGREGELARAAERGGILNAAPFFNRNALVYAFELEGARCYSFFLADDLAAAFEAAGEADGGEAFLAGKTGEIIFHSDSALSRAAARFDGSSYVTELLAGAEESGSRVTRGGAEGRRFVSFRRVSGGALAVHSFPLDKPLDEVNGAFLRGLCLSAAFLFAGLFLLRLLSKTVIVPLGRLTRAAEEIADGNFNVRLKGGSVDELGRLGARFARMAENLKAASAFSDAAIVRAFLRRDIDETLAKKNAVVARVNMANLADIKKHTGAAELGVYVSRFISAVYDCAVKTNGTAEPFSGGMISCHWGCAFSSGSRNHDAMNAVRAALMTRLLFADFNHIQKKKKKPPLIYTFALDTGVVSAGIAGGEYKKEYTVFGNAVKNAKNIALMNEGNAFDILISEKIYLRVRSFVIAEKAAGIETEDGGPVFAVINIRTAEGITQPVPRNAPELKKLLGGDYEDTDGAS